MKIAVSVAIFLSLCVPFSLHASEVITYVHPSSNAKPAKWMYDAMYQNGIRGTLIVTPTVTSGSRDKYHRRGHRDTIIVIPMGLEVATSTDVIYWFHGLTGFKEKTFKTRLGPQYSWLVNEQMFPAILVITEMPWSWFTKTRWKRQGKVFRKPDQFHSYTKEIESIIMSHLGVDRDIRFDRVIIGHSAGGSAIASAAKSGGLCKSKPVGVVFSDSTYGNWFNKAWRGCLKKYSSTSQVRIIVLGQSFGSPWKRYSQWQKKNMMSSRRIEAHRLPLPWTHGRIGNNVIPFVYYGFPGNKYRDVFLPISARIHED